MLPRTAAQPAKIERILGRPVTIFVAYVFALATGYVLPRISSDLGIITHVIACDESERRVKGHCLHHRAPERHRDKAVQTMVWRLPKPDLVLAHLKNRTNSLLDESKIVKNRLLTFSILVIASV